MQKLYLDCDGVILDTVSKDVYEKLIKLGYKTQSQVKEYFSKLNWDEYIIERGQIDNACDKIKELCKYYDVEILTHVNSEEEGNSKIKYFSKELPNVKIITVPKTIKKADYVNAKGAVLVDDYLPNLDYWNQNDGIAVKFSNSGKECDYITITDLLELININFKVKQKVKE